jgi:crotonobetainyl-CoA:carnitine CoA-transferase CaiB-like acyl-CoA transferase
MAGPLSRIRVLDLSRVLAGPWSTQMLADLGADVIKVERPILGDDTRHWGPPWMKAADGSETRDSAYFSSANRNKRSIAIDFTQEAGRELVRDMARQCDVLVENYKVGDLKRYELSYEELRVLNPRLIYCSVTGYGQDGPYSHKPGYDYIFQGEGGLMSINGESDDKPGGGPMKTSIAVTDVLTGLNATIAILAALESRHHSNEGQHIDISLLDTIVHFGSNQVASYFASGEIPRRWGNAHPNLTPYQPFKTADGHIIIACGNDGQFKKLCGYMGHEEWARDPRFLRMSDRNQNRQQLVDLMTAVFTRHPTSHWLQLLADCDVPNGSINTYDKVFEHPQVVHRELKVDQTMPDGSTVSSVRNPIRLSGTPIEYRFPPPKRAQHTDEILKDVFGFSQDRIAQLKDQGAIEAATEAAAAPQGNKP